MTKNDESNPIQSSHFPWQVPRLAHNHLFLPAQQCVMSLQAESLLHLLLSFISSTCTKRLVCRRRSRRLLGASSRLHVDFDSASKLRSAAQRRPRRSPALRLTQPAGNVLSPSSGAARILKILWKISRTRCWEEAATASSSSHSAHLLLHWFTQGYKLLSLVYSCL